VIWLSWRLQRSELLIIALVLALAGAVLVPTGLHMASVYDRAGVGACTTHAGPSCASTLDAFRQRFDGLGSLMSWFNLVPGIVGALLAAPLVLDVEHGTFRLAWTQSVTRRRWLVCRLLVAAGTALTVSVVFTLVLTWWRGPLDALGERLSGGFEFEGLVPGAYTLFAAALVLAVGVVLRRTATAIGLGLVGFLATRIAVEVWARPHYAAAIHRTWTRGTGPDLRGAWILEQSNRLQLAPGRRPDPAAVTGCLHDGTMKVVNHACLAEQGVSSIQSVVYHPASRFWLFQGVEAGIFLGLAAALVAFSAWWIQRRVA
jgi:hypothetical protein